MDPSVPASASASETVASETPQSEGNQKRPNWMAQLPEGTRASPSPTASNGVVGSPSPTEELPSTLSPTPSSPKTLTHIPKISYSSAKNVAGKYISMTFDDGPHKTHTPRLLDMLKARGIRATFYVVGQNAKMYPELIARMVAEGHEVANHTWSHPWLTKISDSAIRSQLRRTEEILMQAGTPKPTVLRPPFGAISSRQRKWIYEEFGYRIVMWSVDPQDWKRPGSSVVTRRLVSGARSGSILLAHDIHGPTIDAMPATLDQLTAKGFAFVTTSELLAMDRDVVAASAQRN